MQDDFIYAFDLTGAPIGRGTFVETLSRYSIRHHVTLSNALHSGRAVLKKWLFSTSPTPPTQASQRADSGTERVEFFNVDKYDDWLTGGARAHSRRDEDF